MAGIRPPPIPLGHKGSQKGQARTSASSLNPRAKTVPNDQVELLFSYLFLKALPSVGLAGPSRWCTTLTHRGVLVDQQVGVEEVVYEVGQPVAPAWEEDKKLGVFLVALQGQEKLKAESGIRHRWAEGW